MPDWLSLRALETAHAGVSHRIVLCWLQLYRRVIATGLIWIDDNWGVAMSKSILPGVKSILCRLKTFPEMRELDVDNPLWIICWVSSHDFRWRCWGFRLYISCPNFKAFFRWNCVWSDSCRHCELFISQAGSSVPPAWVPWHESLSGGSVLPFRLRALSTLSFLSAAHYGYMGYENTYFLWIRLMQSLVAKGLIFLNGDTGPLVLRMPRGAFWLLDMVWVCTLSNMWDSIIFDCCWLRREVEVGSYWSLWWPRIEEQPPVD